MWIRTRRDWEIDDAQATPEPILVERRRLLRGLAAGAVLGGTTPWLLAACDGPPGEASYVPEDDPSAPLYPVERNQRYTVEREITPASWSTRYNNFLEFGSSKRIDLDAQALPLRPWTITIDGLVEAETTIGIDDLLARMPLEERVYRHRCVETWAMVVPWSGFPLKALVDLARPLGSAKYLALDTFMEPEVARGQRAFWYPWPYREALTMAEATNELAFMVTGAYGKPLLKQNGAPLRLAVPWKYGFKSAKSIQRLTFSEARPTTFWEEVAGDEYGFWANVNPKVPHKRWSQRTERQLGTREETPTRLFNGYEEFVAHMYKGLKGERLFT